MLYFKSYKADEDVGGWVDLGEFGKLSEVHWQCLDWEYIDEWGKGWVFAGETFFKRVEGTYTWDINDIDSIWSRRMVDLHVEESESKFEFISVEDKWKQRLITRIGQIR